LESIEPRLLLSADLSVAASLLPGFDVAVLPSASDGAATVRAVGEDSARQRAVVDMSMQPQVALSASASGSELSRPSAAWLNLANGDAVGPTGNDLALHRLLAADASAISPAASAALTAGTAGFATWMDTVGAHEQFAQPLPALQQPLGEALDLGQTLLSRVAQPIASYLSTDATPTVGELRTILEGLDATVGDLVFQSTVTGSGIFGAAGQEELRYDLVLDFQWTRQIGLDLGVAGSDGLYLLDAGAQARFGLVLDLALGVDLRPGLTPANAFFIRPDDLRASFDLHAGLDAEIAIGFLGANIEGGRIDVDADLALRILNPDSDAQGRITLTELQATPLASLVRLTGTGGLTADLPISARLGGWELTGSPRISLALSDPFSGQPPQVAYNADATPSSPFRSLNASGVMGLLNQIATWGDGWLTTPRTETTLLDGPLPFAAEHTFGDLLSVGQAIRTELLEPLQATEGVLPFQTAQELAAKLAEILGIPVANTQLNYDEALRELSYRISFEHAFDPVTLPIDFNFDLEPLASLSSTSTVRAAPVLTAGMTFGVSLMPFSATIEGATPLPVNGRLLGEATFQLSAVGAAAVLVRVSADATNATRADLVADINAALAAAGLPSIVTAGVNASGHLTLTATRPGLGVSLLIGEVNAAAAQLGLTAYKTAGDSLADHAWLQDAAFTGAITVSAADIQASATVGFLDIEITQGQASVNASVSASLKNGAAGAPGGRITVRDLALSLRDDPAELASFEFAGSASASLQQIRVVDNFLGVIEGNPTVTVAWSDITDLDTLQVTTNVDFNPVRALQNAAAAQIIDLLEEVRDWLREVEQASFFADDLPIINRSPNDLLKLSKRVDDLIVDIRKDPPKSMQKLQAWLVDRLAPDAGNEPSAAPADDSGTKVTYTDGILTIDLKFDETFTSPGPFKLSADLSSLGLPPELSDLASLGGTGELAVTGGAKGRVVFGFDVTQPLLPTPFISDVTQAEITAKVDATDLDFGLALGPLGLFVVNGTARLDDGAAAVADRKPAKLTLTMDPDASDHRYSFFEALSKFNVDLDGYAQTTLPLHFPTTSNPLSPALIFTVADLGSPLSTTTLRGPDLGEFIDQLNLVDNLEALRLGWDQLLDLVETLLQRNVLNVNLPLVGDQLEDTLDFIKRMREQLKGSLGLLPSYTVVTVQQALYTAFGPSGLNWLQDREDDNDKAVTAADIKIQTDGVEYVQFDMVLAEAVQLLKADLDFDIGLPALGLDLDGAVAFGAGFRWELGFGVSKKDGVYLDTTASDDAELTVDFGATLPNFQAVGRLGFLQLSAKDDPDDPSLFGGELSVDFIAPEAESRLRLRDLQSGAFSFEQALDASLQASAEVNLNLVLGFSKIGVLPSLEVDFNLGWNFTPDDTDLRGGVPNVAFNDVRLNLGSFFSSFAGPVLGQVQEVLGPLQPVIDALNTRVPVLSDLLGEDLNFFEAAQRFGTSSQSQFADYLQAAADLVTLVNSIPAIEGNQYIMLGSFNLSGTDVRAVDSVQEVAPNATETKDTVGQLTGEAATFYSRTQDVGNRAMSFPLLDNPLQAFRLLLGQDVDIFLYDMPALELSFERSWSFSVAPLVDIVLGGGIGARLDLAFGYDTSGLREFARTGYFSDAFDGFFVSDRLNANGTGADVPEVRFWANVYAAVEVNVVVLWAGIEGGIEANVYLDLKDPDNDGKVHVEEFLQELDGGLLSTFDVSGSLQAYIEAYVKAGFKKWGIEIVLFEWDFEIARVTLADFRAQPADGVWDGGGDGSTWNDARNWSNDRLPDASDDVVINVPDREVTITVRGDYAAASIKSREAILFESIVLDRQDIEVREVILGGGATLFIHKEQEIERIEVRSGGTATLREDDVADLREIAVLSGGRLWLDGRVEGGTITVQEGGQAHVRTTTAVMDGVTIAGNVVVDAGAVLTPLNALTLYSGARGIAGELELHGTLPGGTIRGTGQGFVHAKGSQAKLNAVLLDTD